MNCDRCGHSEIGGSAFCSACGAALPTPAHRTATSVIAPQPGGSGTATAEMVGRNCPYCRFPLKTGVEIAECPICHAVHHADCFADNGGCAVMGCEGAAAPTAQTAAAPASSSVPPAPPTAVMGAVAPPPQAPLPPAPGGPRGGPHWKIIAAVVAVLAALAGATAAVVIATTSHRTVATITDTTTDTTTTDTTTTDTTTTDTTTTDTTGTGADALNAVESYWSDINNGDFAGAYGYLTSNGAGGGSESDFVSSEQSQGVQSASFSGHVTDSSDTTATIGVDSLVTHDNSSGCQTWSGDYQMVNQGGSWLIDKAEISASPC